MLVNGAASTKDTSDIETEEPGSSAYAALVEQAASLAPLLRERAQESEALRKLPEDIIIALRRAGVFRMVQPKRVGGLGLAPTALFDVGSALGQGCASTAWVVGNLAVHHMHLAFFPAQAQATIWGQSPDVLIGSSNIFKSGFARKVDGGYLLRGRWPFSSGIHHCSWTTLGGQVPIEGSKDIESRYFLLSKDQFRILDTWHTAGLKGTGSADIDIPEEVFVPEGLTVSQLEVAGTSAAGLLLNPEPMYRFPYSAGGVYILVGALHGAAVGAIADYTAQIKTGVSRTSGAALINDPSLQSKIARASACADTVATISRQRINNAFALLKQGKSCNGMVAVELRRDASFCAELCVEAVDIVFAAAGGAALYDSNPLQKAWRDIHAGAAHMSLRWDSIAPPFGRVLLGLGSGLPGLEV